MIDRNINKYANLLKNGDDKLYFEEVLFLKYFKKLPYFISIDSLYNNNDVKNCLNTFLSCTDNLNILNIHNIIEDYCNYQHITYIDKTKKIIIKHNSFKNMITNENILKGIDIFYLKKTTEIKKLLQDIDNIKPTNLPENKIGFVLQSSGGLYVANKELKLSYKNTDFDTHYNSDFNQFDIKVKEVLASEKNGIIILSGIAGSGKSSYLKHLLDTCNQKFVFFPVGLLKSVENSPALMSFFVEHGEKDTCYIIEDAENVIQSDDASRPSGLSTLLNFSDSIISDVFRCKFILTFNKDNIYDNIDPALLRKGRLLANYDFKKLKLEKVKKLFKNLYGKEYEDNKELSLAEVYNYYNDNLYSEKEKDKKIGFFR